MKSKTPAPEILPPVLVTFLLDESGSMQSYKDQVVRGFEEYLSTLRERATVGQDIRLTLMIFNSRGITRLTEARSVKAVGSPLEMYQPNDGTPLYDALGEAIRLTVEQIADASQKWTWRQRRGTRLITLDGDDEVSAFPSVLFVTFTDGCENASAKENRTSIKKLIEEKTQAGWEFVYLGANQDAWEEGVKFGLKQGATLSYAASGQGVNTAYAGLTSGTQAYFSRGAVSVSSTLGARGITNSSAGFFTPQAQTADKIPVTPEEDELWKTKAQQNKS